MSVSQCLDPLNLENNSYTNSYTNSFYQTTAPSHFSTSKMPFPYKHVLLVGATSGIGLAMAERLIQDCKVTVVGRRKDRLDDFVAKHGEKANAISFDISDTEKAPQFAADAIREFPDIDCIFLNAGYQRLHDFSKPETLDIKGFNNEMHVNYTSLVILTHAFLPYLLARKEETSFILFVARSQL